MKGVCFCLLLLFSLSTLCYSTQLFDNIEPSSCASSQYFHFSSLRCVACGEFQQKSPDSISCECQPGAKLVSYFGGPEKTCQPCAPPKVVTKDGWECSDCPTGRPYDSTTKQCASCVLPLQHQVDRSETGDLLSRRSCLQCKADTAPSASAGVCGRCHSQVLKVTGGGSCTCPTNDVFTGGVCLSRTSEIPADDITSYIIRHQNNFLSAYFKENFRAAKVLCQENQNLTACQQLGNLCVLLMYNEDNSNRAATDACKEYLALVRASTDYIAGITDWPQNMPWLYYKDDGSTVVLEKENIPQTFTRGEIIKFNLVSYRLNGSFFGIRKDPSILQLCSQPTSITEKAFTMTNQYSVSCKISVAKLLEQETVFFDLFLRVKNDRSQYPVPVLVDNLQERGTYVNRDTQRKNWKLNRRFFLVDKYSGLRNIDNSVPSFIQYASSIELEFQLIEDGKFYPPLLKIKYGVRNVDVGTMKTDLVDIEFKVTYSMDTSQLDNNIQITVGVLSALGVVYALVKISSWRRREGLQVLDCTSCMLFIVYVFSALALVFLTVIFVSCIQWQFFFKRQTTVIRVLPTADQEKLVGGLLVAAFVMKLFDVAYILYSQIYVDIFFIDWERPRGAQVTGTDGNTVTTPVSVMRTLFVANEWREIQTIRRIKPTFQIIVVVLFLQGFGFQYWTTTDPVNRLSVDRNAEYVGVPNLCLRIAVVSLLYFIIAVVQWIIYGFVYERFVGDAIGDFIDFCSMSNISVFVMSQKQYGHYIHGRSVHGRSDTSLYELYEQFQREEDNLCGKRGLEPNSERQSFEMALTVRFRNEYSKIVQPLLTRDVQGARRGQQMSRQNPGLPGSHLTPALERSVKAYNQMNRYLSSFVEHAIRDNDYTVKDKLLLEKLLKNELQPPLDKSIFYNDDGRSFTSILLYGQEWSLLLFNLLLFIVVDWLSGWNSILAGFVTYMADIIITSVRDSLGKNNLAAKTMLDQRFLI